MGTDAWEYRQKVFSLSKECRFPEAYELVKEALTIYPSNPFLLNSEIYVIYRMGNVKEARQKAEEQFQTLKNNQSFLRTYLSILDKSGDHEDILRLIDSGVLSQDFQGKAKPDFFIHAARIVSRAGFTDRGLEILRKAPQLEEIEKEIEKFGSHMTRSGKLRNPYVEHYRGKRAAVVIKEIEGIRMLAAYKDDFPLHHYLAEKYKKTGQLDKAAEVYRYLLTIRDDTFTRNRLGYVCKDMGLLDEAVIYFKEGLMKEPFQTHLHTALADIFVKRNDPEGFERVVTDILAVHPNAGHLYGIIKKVKNLCSN